MSETQSWLTEMSPDQCRERLITHRPRLGRLTFVDSGWPLVLPMNYVIRGDAIYFRTAPGSKVFIAAQQGLQASFEVDEVDEFWEDGWSILAFGHLRQVTDAEELTEVLSLPLQPWAGGDRPHCIALQFERMSGRRIA